MKHRFLLLAVLLICTLPLSSFKAEFNSTALKTVAHQTDVEYGEFTSGGHIYAVYGDSSGSTITGIYYFDGLELGAAVYSWSGTGSKGVGTKPGHANVTVYTDATHSFPYNGDLLYY
jgi:hypothetical protein